MTKTPKGLYQTPAVGSREAEAYVTDGTIGSFVPKSTYRMRNYQPEFDTLPSEDEYRAPASAGKDNAHRP